MYSFNITYSIKNTNGKMSKIFYIFEESDQFKINFKKFSTNIFENKIFVDQSIDINDKICIKFQIKQNQSFEDFFYDQQNNFYFYIDGLDGKKNI